MALPYYENLRTLYPKQAEYQYKYGGALGMLARQSNVFAALSMIDNIKAAFTRAIALNPKHIPARWAMIELNLQLPEIVGGSKQKALAYSAELAVISPVDGYLSRGHIEEYFKRYANAEQQYLKAIEVSNSKTAYEKLAELYKNKMGQPQKAARLLAIFNQKNKS